MTRDPAFIGYVFGVFAGISASAVVVSTVRHAEVNAVPGRVLLAIVLAAVLWVVLLAVLAMDMAEP